MRVTDVLRKKAVKFFYYIRKKQRVIFSYMPYAGIYKKRMVSIVYKMNVSDFHNDILTSANQKHLHILSAQTVRCVCAIYGGRRCFQQVEDIVRFFENNREKNLYLALEDANYLSKENIETICSWKPICVSLTWNWQNELAGGCYSDGGLSKKGKEIVKVLTGNGIYIDCAHLNRKSFYAVADMTSLIVNTHTCLCAVHPHQRNIDDVQIRELIERKGLIGITFVGKFLSNGGASVQDVFRHIDHGVQKFGDRWFCLGTDFNGSKDFPPNLRAYAQMDNLFDLFVKAGYPLATIRSVFFENLQNFLTKHR